MAAEPRRGCGFRKIGGLYLVSGGAGQDCDRLPILLDVCPVCSHGFKQSRGWTWVDVAGLTGGIHRGCADDFACPLCMATGEMGRAGLIWIGERFYMTPADYIAEGHALGYSRRISAVPHGFETGKTWVLLAHPKAMRCQQCAGAGRLADEVGGGYHGCPDCEKTGMRPAIFQVWRPTAIEKLLPESKRGSEEAQNLEKRGIVPVYVADDDKDHQGTVYDKEDEESATAAEGREP